MARIPQDELDRLKRDVDLVELLTARGVELKANGKDLVGLCPFHEETEGSFRVSPGKNLFHCFGCGAKGSVVDLVMRFEGVTFRHAVEILRAGVPLATPPTDRPPPKRSSTVKLDQVVTEDAGDAELRAQVVDYYHETLKRSPEALRYLEGRGLDPEALVDRFRLGYSNRTLGYHLPQSNRKDGKAIRGRLAELGIIKETGHELLRGSLVVPIFNAEGQVVQMYGRKITPNLRAGTPKHLYLPGPFRGIFNLDALRQSKEVILCEALVDALTFVSAGYSNVTSAYGKNGFTDELFEAFMAYGVKRALIAYDRDEGGDNAAEALADRLGAEGISCFRVRFPHNMDANEYALKVTPPAQSLGVLLRSAEYMSGPLQSESDPPAQPFAGMGVEGPPESRQITEAEPSSSLAAVPEPPVKTQEVAASPAPSAPAARSPAPVPAIPAPPAPPPTPEPASPVPPLPRPDIPAEVSEHQVVLRLGDRYWRVRGLAKNLSFEQMRVNVFVALSGAADRFHQDAFDLYSAKQRQGFIRHAAVELGATEALVKKDLGNVLLKLEQLQEAAIRSELEAKTDAPSMTAAERESALELLKTPALLDRIADDFERCGVVGERTNKLVAFLAAVSRKLAKPLAVMLQSSSAAGKSALMKAVLAFMPADELVAYSAMTGQSLFYMGETDLKHKVLAIAEEEGAEKASYALKLLQSEGELTIASTGKDPKTGRLTTHEYHVEGPSAILTTTTAIDLDEELLNRCIVLTVDESREQTRAIHRRQREEETLEGYFNQLERQEIVKLHQNAQRLLRPLAVVNPFARQLTFLDAKTRTRRDHLKYLALIRAIALIHQHQRPLKIRKYRGKDRPYVEVSIADISAANELAAEVLGRTLDELPPQTRRFLLDLDAMVTGICEARGVGREALRFTARQIREHAGWGATQVKVHVKRLVEMEYLLVYHAPRGQGFVYELLYEGEGRQGEPFVIGLIDVERIKKQHYDEQRSEFAPDWAESKPKRSARGRPEVGGVSGGCRTPENDEKVNGDRHSDGEEGGEPENARIGSQKKASSYCQPDRSRSEGEDSEKKLGKKTEEKIETEDQTTQDEPDEAPETVAVAAHGGRRS